MAQICGGLYSSRDVVDLRMDIVTPNHRIAFNSRSRTFLICGQAYHVEQLSACTDNIVNLACSKANHKSEIDDDVTLRQPWSGITCKITLVDSDNPHHLQATLPDRKEGRRDAVLHSN